jgi:hypothetical protein
MAIKVGKFNFGGIFGGLVCGSAAFAIIYLLSNHRFPMGGYKAVALAAFGGAALGNWIWNLATPSDPDPFAWTASNNRTEKLKE